MHWRSTQRPTRIAEGSHPVLEVRGEAVWAPTTKRLQMRLFAAGVRDGARDSRRQRSPSLVHALVHRGGCRVHTQWRGGEVERRRVAPGLGIPQAGAAVRGPWAFVPQTPAHPSQPDIRRRAQRAQPGDATQGRWRIPATWIAAHFPNCHTQGLWKCRLRAPGHGWCRDRGYPSTPRVPRKSGVRPSSVCPAPGDLPRDRSA